MVSVRHFLMPLLCMTMTCSCMEGGASSDSGGDKGGKGPNNTGTPGTSQPQGDEVPNPPGTSQPQSSGTPNPPPPQVNVLDKTTNPGLRPAVPTNAAVAGWTKTKAPDPVDIPATVPAVPEVYYSASATVGSKIRTISVVYGNLLKEQDAIVNAANGGLEGGSGVDGAIHKGALVNGKDLMVEEAKAYKKLYNIGSFPVGSAMVMHPYGLKPKIKMVVFTVGPRGPSNDTTNLQLYSAIYNSLLKAAEYGAKSVSIPAVSTGIFGFPKDVATRLFFKAALEYFKDHPNTTIEAVRFTNFDKNTVEPIAQGFLATF